MRAEVSDEPKAVFIYHIVTKMDLVPKKPAPVPQAGGAQDGAAAAVKAFVAGSRWEWFDKPDFSGKAYYRVQKKQVQEKSKGVFVSFFLVLWMPNYTNF